MPAIAYSLLQNVFTHELSDTQKYHRIVMWRGSDMGFSFLKTKIWNVRTVEFAHGAPGPPVEPHRTPDIKVKV